MENKPKRPANYLAISIISTILCCLPAGIVSIVYAAKVNSLYDDEHYDQAETASKNAKTWTIVSVSVALVGWIIYVAIFGLAFLGMMSEGNF